MRLLLIEDDLNLSNDLKRQFIAKDIHVDVVYDGLIAEKMILRESYDCILADVNIPGKNGYELAKSARQKQVTTPIIMLTAFGEISDKLEGFDSGADDYITKPFFFEELLARIKVILKRTQRTSEKTDVIAIQDLVIDVKRRAVTREGNPIKLTAREYEILVMLAEADGQVVSKREILGKVWGSAYGTNTNTIEVFINLLRNKIDKQFDAKLIKTRIGFGYSLGEGS